MMMVMVMSINSWVHLIYHRICIHADTWAHIYLVLNINNLFLLSGKIFVEPGVSRNEFFQRDQLYLRLHSWIVDSSFNSELVHFNLFCSNDFKACMWIKMIYLFCKLFNVRIDSLVILFKVSWGWIGIVFAWLYIHQIEIYFELELWAL